MTQLGKYNTDILSGHWSIAQSRQNMPKPGIHKTGDTLGTQSVEWHIYESFRYTVCVCKTDTEYTFWVYVPINIMPHYPSSGQITGIIWGFVWRDRAYSQAFDYFLDILICILHKTLCVKFPVISYPPWAIWLEVRSHIWDNSHFK